MAFPTSSLTNNQVHKEGNRAFVYDSALGVWDQVRETDRTENKILSGEIGSGVTFPAGHVIQVVQDILVTAACFTTNQRAWSDIGLELDITPAKTGNKIWIQVVVNVGVETGRDAKARCLRDDTTDILVATGMQGTQVSSFGSLGADTDSESHDRVYPLLLNYVDSPTIPSTPESINYKIQLYHDSADDGNTICYNRSYQDTNAQRSARVSSTLIAMEVSS